MRRFRSQDFVTVESAERFGVFQLRCPMCSTQRVIVAVWGRSSVRTFASDLDAEEWLYYRNLPPIHYDDVIRVARLMSEYEGDFSDVLEDPLFDERPGDQVEL
jgi:hypothetical protein